MSAKIENHKLKNAKQERSLDSGSNSGQTTAGAVATSAAQTLKKRQGNNNNNTREDGQAKRIKRRRPTKVALNDTLRHIRHLIFEGRNNLEIQNILQLGWRTFYRYMVKIYEIDQACLTNKRKKRSQQTLAF